MKKQIILTIIIGYATLLPLGIHACPGSLAISEINSIVPLKDIPQFKDYGQLQYLENPIKQARFTYISRNSYIGALCATVPVAAASKLYFHNNPHRNTANNIGWATAGIIISGLSGYGLGHLYAWAQIEKDESLKYSSTGLLEELTFEQKHLSKNLTEALHKLKFDIYDAKQATQVNELDYSEQQLHEKLTLTAKQLYEKAAALNKIFENPTYRGPKESNRYEEILTTFELPYKASKASDTCTDAKRATKESIKKLNHAKKNYDKIQRALEKCKGNSYLTEIISDAEVKRNIEAFMWQYELLYAQSSNMQLWLANIQKATDKTAELPKSIGKEEEEEEE